MSEGSLVDGILEKHECSAGLDIYVSKDGLRAIVIPVASVPHSHPAFPRSKITRVAMERYTELVQQSGCRPTVLSVERGIYHLLL